MVFEENRSGWFSKKNSYKLWNDKLSCFKDYAVKKVNEN